MDQDTFQGWVNKITATASNSANAPRLAGIIDEFADALRTSTIFAGFIPDPGILEGVLDWVGQPVFLCGVNRKDERGLQQVLARHPNLLVLPGSFYFYKKHQLWLDACYIDVAREGVAYLVNPPDTEALWVLGQQDSGVYERYLKYLHLFLHYSKQNASICMIMALYAAVPAQFSAVKYWVEASPDNEQYVYSLSEKFPEARFIHLTRDSSPSSIHSAQSNLEQAGGDRYHLLRTEDLLENEENALREVCDFLDIQFKPFAHIQ
jgi:hypothetical protein